MTVPLKSGKFCTLYDATELKEVMRLCKTTKWYVYQLARGNHWRRVRNRGSLQRMYYRKVDVMLHLRACEAYQKKV